MQAVVLQSICLVQWQNVKVVPHVVSVLGTLLFGDFAG